MRIALIDNGSLEPAAHRSLRAAALALTERTGLPVDAVSWRHSDRIPAEALDGAAAATLAPWLRRHRRRGEDEFLFIPFFISGQGAIAGFVRSDLEALRRTEGGFGYAFTAGLAPAVEILGEIVAARVRETIAARGLRAPAVVVVDHGGPARRSAELRDAVTAAARGRLAGEVAGVAAASMESPDGPGFAFNQPLLAGQLAAPGFDRGDVVIAPLFLAPGRHAGPEGDLAQIARDAAARAPGLRCHFAALIGSHPLAIAAFGRTLREVLPAPAVL
jgi:hypothetical protein